MSYLIGILSSLSAEAILKLGNVTGKVVSFNYKYNITVWKREYQLISDLFIILMVSIINCLLIGISYFDLLSDTAVVGVFIIDIVCVIALNCLLYSANKEAVLNLFYKSNGIILKVGELTKIAQRTRRTSNIILDLLVSTSLSTHIFIKKFLVGTENQLGQNVLDAMFLVPIVKMLIDVILMLSVSYEKYDGVYVLESRSEIIITDNTGKCTALSLNDHVIMKDDDTFYLAEKDKKPVLLKLSDVNVNYITRL